MYYADEDEEENFQQVFKAKFRCQVKPIVPSGARLGTRQANANHHLLVMKMMMMMMVVVMMMIMMVVMMMIKLRR